MPKVSVIILNWNQPEFTVNCVKSVLKQSYQDFEILLVDNGSEDNSLEIFKREFGKNEKIRILETGKNLGYAGGNNFGVEHAKGEYIVILNNDTIAEEKWLEELVNGVKSDPNIGAVSSREIRVGENLPEIDWKTEGITRTLVWYPVRFRRKEPLENADIAPLLPIKGCSFIYKKGLLELPFDSEYFIYAEDDYLAWLLNLKGYQNKIATKSVVRHFHNIVRKSSKKINEYFIFLGERNRIMNMLIFYELSTLIRIIPLVLMNMLLLNMIEIRKSPYRIKAYLWLLINPFKILEKRKHIQKQRKISDNQLLVELSCKIRDETVFEDSTKRRILVFINRLSCVYSRIVGLKAVETS